MKKLLVGAIILIIVITGLLIYGYKNEAKAQAISGGIALTPQKEKPVPMLSFKRFNTPWFAPITVGRVGSDDRVEFGFGASYILSNHTAVSAEYYKDWNTNGKTMKASLKLFW